jgi:hypothetical protein
MVDKLDVFQYGWDIKNGILSPIIATQAPFPYGLRELLDLPCTEKNAILQNVCVSKKAFTVLQHVNKCSQLCQNICNQSVSDESGDEDGADF